VMGVSWGFNRFCGVGGLSVLSDWVFLRVLVDLRCSRVFEMSGVFERMLCVFDGFERFCICWIFEYFGGFGRFCTF
jgi:hypothetical protein